MKHVINRSDPLRRTAVLACAALLSALLAACGTSAASAPTAVPTSAPTTAPTAMPSAASGKIALLPETKTTRYETADRPDFQQKFMALCPSCEIIYNNANQDANACKADGLS